MTDIFSFEAVYKAYKSCLRGKRNTRNAQRYQIHLLDNLWQTVQQLQQHQWTMGHAIFFIALQPKVREIHAADFSERVVHHLLVPELEKIYEPIFIHDCYSNRKNKGTHKAVKRTQGFMKSCLDKQGQAYFLQLDIKNFFNTIDKPILQQLIKTRLKKTRRHTNRTPTTRRSQERSVIRQLPPAEGHSPSPEGDSYWASSNKEKARQLYWCCKQLLKPREDNYLQKKGPKWTFERVPEYKRLKAGTDKGLPIGNLTSQFFANVYLNELDQYIKHQLKCKYYVRYVDDMVLVHHNEQQLQQWKKLIETFLMKKLLLELKSMELLKPVSQGADFLGYIIRPGYVLVRRRVVTNLINKLNSFETQIVRVFRWSQERSGIRESSVITLPAIIREKLRTTLASYLGHFKHANCMQLIKKIKKRFPWLTQLFDFHYQGKIAHQGIQLRPKWQPLSVTSLQSQWLYFKKQMPQSLVIIQCGHVFELYHHDATIIYQRLKYKLLAQTKINRHKVTHCIRVYHADIKCFCKKLRQQQLAYQLIVEEGFLPGGMKKRVLRQCYQL